MENVAGEQDLALQQHFRYKTSKFFDTLFLFLAFFKL